jgi:hypothetical protein
MVRTLSLVCALLAASATTALAQDTGDPLAVPGEGTDDTSAGASAGGEASVGGEASAGGEVSAGGELSANGTAGGEEGGAGGGFGVGIVAMLTGPFGAAVVYDPGRFHIEGILGFRSLEDSQTDIAVGGRFWWHLHTSTAADFSLGGGIGFVLIDREDPLDDQTDIHIDGGAQVRTFVVPNVALAASLGLAIVSGDADFVGITGQLFGSIGATYFF